MINKGVINSKEYASANSKTVKLKKAQLNPITCRIDLIPIKIVLLGRKLPDFLSVSMIAETGMKEKTVAKKII